MVTRTILYVLALAAVTLVIWHWNRGAQRRRFRRAFPHPAEPAWPAADGAFLDAFERAFALPRGAARNLPRDVTAMGVYLILYPEHCIYDDSEPTRFAAALRGRLGKATPPDALTLPLGDLAARWRAAAPNPANKE